MTEATAEASLGGARAAAPARPRFYMWMAWVCLAIAVLGFLPTYFLPMAQGKFDEPPIIHIHGMVLFSWVAFFVVQTTLAAQGRIADHRTWGVLGIAIVTAMVFVVTGVETMRLHPLTQPGVSHRLAENARAFAWVTMGGLAVIAPMFVLAIVNVRRPEVHKRLLLLMTAVMMTPPLARWFQVLLAPKADPNAPPLVLPPGVVPQPPVFVSIPPAMLSDLIVVAAMIYDWRTRGRPHPVYLIGGAVVLAYQLTVAPVGHSAAWQAAATWIGGLMG